MFTKSRDRLLNGEIASKFFVRNVLRLQLSYLSKEQALAVADTILRTAAQIIPAARGSGVMQNVMWAGTALTGCGNRL